jgi:hypothetical protein
MNNPPDFKDQLEVYAAKMRMENDPMWRVGVEAERTRMKADAARMAIADLEESRWQFSQAIIPFMPEPAPVALQSAPEPPRVHVNSHHLDPYPEEVFEAPKFMGGRG